MIEEDDGLDKDVPARTALLFQIEAYVFTQHTSLPDSYTVQIASIRKLQSASTKSFKGDAV